MKVEDVMESKTRIEFMSRSLWYQFREYLKENAKNQNSGMAVNYGITDTNNHIYYSNLTPFEVLQKLCNDFKQVATGSIQWGDMCLVNQDTGKSNSDTPQAPALTQNKSYCWYNIGVSSRVSNFSRAF